jgi:hypothetical protein
VAPPSGAGHKRDTQATKTSNARALTQLHTLSLIICQNKAGKYICNDYEFIIKDTTQKQSNERDASTTYGAGLTEGTTALLGISPSLQCVHQQKFSELESLCSRLL